MATVQVRCIVNDVDAAIEFYTKELGFALEMHPAPAFAMLSRGDLRLVLSAPNPGPGGGSSDARRDHASARRLASRTREGPCLGRTAPPGTKCRTPWPSCKVISFSTPGGCKLQQPAQNLPVQAAKPGVSGQRKGTSQSLVSAGRLGRRRSDFQSPDGQNEMTLGLAGPSLDAAR